MGSLIRLELVRAYENYFKIKGGISPKVASEILPVVVMDDTSRGPYPAYRQWEIGRNSPAVAAQFSYIAIMNNDSPGTKSVMVVDELYVRPATVADDIVVASGSETSIVLGATAQAQDTAEEKDQSPSILPTMAMVLSAVLQSATNLGGSTIPHNALTGARIKGPWTYGPLGTLWIRPAVVNNALFVYARGRYYDPI